MKELLLEISYNCNLNCIHCSSILCDGKISINEDLCKIKDIGNFDTVRLSGEEPTLNEDLIYYILFFTKREVK